MAGNHRMDLTSSSRILFCHLKWSCLITVIKLKGAPSSSFCFHDSPLPWKYHDTFGDNGVYKSASEEWSEDILAYFYGIRYNDIVPSSENLIKIQNNILKRISMKQY